MLRCLGAVYCYATFIRDMRTSRLPPLATGQHGLQLGSMKLIVVDPWVRWPSHIVAKPPLRVPLLSVFPGGLAQTSGLIVCGGSLAFTPKVRSLDGVACVLLCVELNPCRLHVVLLSRAICRICKRDVNALMKVVIE